MSANVEQRDPRSLEAEADRAAAAGNPAAARRLLEVALAAGGESAETWIKLAALCRRLGDLDAALAAVSGALRLDPLGFLPLLLKGSLLEQTGRTLEAGETYGHALAQASEPAPPQLAAMVERAKAVHAEFLAAQSRRLEEAGAAVVERLSEPERNRLTRFRSNILRQTRVYHSEPTDFHYPGLREREFHERQAFPWLAEFEGAAGEIKAEFEAVAASERAELVPYIQYPDDVPLRQWAGLNRNRDWTAIHLVRNGERINENARHCPKTMALLGEADQPHIRRRGPNAMFSLLAPGTHIPPHTGVANVRLVCHLPLIVPPGCWFRVGADTREWQAGEAFVFDDTIEHEAMNPSDALRVVLIIDTWHPDLSAAERDAVAAVMAGVDPADGEGGL